MKKRRAKDENEPWILEKRYIKDVLRLQGIDISGIIFLRREERTVKAMLSGHERPPERNLIPS